MAPRISLVPKRPSRRSRESPDDFREDRRGAYPPGTRESRRGRKKFSSKNGSRPPPGYPKPPKGYPRPPKGSGRPSGYGISQHNAVMPVGGQLNGNLVEKVQDKIMEKLADPEFQEKAAKFLRDQAKKHFEKRAARAAF